MARTRRDQGVCDESADDCGVVDVSGAGISADRARCDRAARAPGSFTAVVSSRAFFAFAGGWLANAADCVDGSARGARLEDRQTRGLPGAQRSALRTRRAADWVRFGHLCRQVLVARLDE